MASIRSCHDIWLALKCSCIRKGVNNVKKRYAYIATTNCKCGFKWICNFLFKNDTTLTSFILSKLKNMSHRNFCLFQMLLESMGHELKNIDHLPQMIRDWQFGATPCQLPMPPLSHCSRIMFNFMVSLKSPCCASKSQP